MNEKVRKKSVKGWLKGAKRALKGRNVDASSCAKALDLTDTFDLQLSRNSEYLMAMMLSLAGSDLGTVKSPFESFV